MYVTKVADIFLLIEVIKFLNVNLFFCRKFFLCFCCFTEFTEAGR